MTRTLRTIADVRPGDHLCHLYETEEDHRAVLIPFLHHGLTQDEKVLCVVDSHTVGDISDYLRGEGLDAEAYLERGQLVVLAFNDVCGLTGAFNPEEMIDLLRAETVRALDDGYSVLRFASEMSWAAKAPFDVKRLVAYEASIDEFLSDGECAGLCQYDRRRFEPAVLLDVLRAHPVAIVDTAIYNNFYYMPPDELQGQDPAAAALHHWVKNLAERQRTKNELEQRAAQLALLNDIGGKVAAVLELNSVLERTARLVQENFGYHHVALFTLDREQGQLVMQTRAGDFADLFPPDHRLKLEQGMVGYVGRRGETLLANDVMAEPHYINLYPDVIPTKSELSVPIRVGEEVVGVLDIQSPRLDAFDENDVMVMETLADQIAVAIENARLYEAVQQELMERRRAEEKLRKSEARYRAVSELTSDFAYSVHVGPDDTVALEWVTDAFTRITGFTPEDVRARGGWQNLIHPDDLSTALRHWEVHSSEQPDVVEYRIVTKSGEVRWLRDYVRPVWDEDRGEVVRTYGAAQDITERKQIEQYMLRTERLAAMGRVAAALAHEIKNPLQAIRSHLELVLDFPLEPDEREEYLHFCYREIDHLNEITERTLGLARPAEEAPAPASMARLMQRALTLVSRPLERAHIQVTTDFPADLPLVWVVSDQFVRVLLNLMINAIEAMPEGGHVHVTARPEGDMMVLRLANDGDPIPPEHIDHVFDPFFTTKPDGTGLGLFISHNVVEQHGGRIDVKNLEDDQGVVFTVALPTAVSVDAQEINEEASL